ncbi:MAG: hypothetical protein QM330_13055 [Acidobacteriota bacterium]|jgi:hypothetical protein|nr:hypothetical protein [Acidobacteriota bacterium]NLT31820.1 DUF4258 domain-containing protein [Acidobacteriota bacterium]
MPRDEKEKTKPGDGKPSLSRREFALASLAVLGAQPLSTAEDPPPLSDEARAMKLVLDEGVRERLEERHITEEDMRRVLCHAEQSGEKLCRPQGGRFLAKLRMAETYFYVEYEPRDGAFRVRTAYAHRLLLEGDPG